jgi:hypothetical protein
MLQTSDLTRTVEAFAANPGFEDSFNFLLSHSSFLVIEGHLEECLNYCDLISVLKDILIGRFDCTYEISYDTVREL